MASFALFTSLAIAAYIIYNRFESRRVDQVRISDLSMARQEPVKDTEATTTSIETVSDEQKSKHSIRRLRAFLPAEEAVMQLKRATGSSKSISTVDSQSSSNPWDRRRSSLTSSDPSLLNHAEIYYYSNDSESSRWEKVRSYSKSSESLKSSVSTLKSRRTTRKELPTPPPSPPVEADGEKETRSPRDKLRDLFTPKPLAVFDSPPPDLHSGDFRAALALIGAVGAAYSGGRAMQRCPVEVTPAYGLPDSWMHTAPQDAMGSVSYTNSGF